MSLNNALLLMSGDDGVTDSYQLSNSLRFRSSASAYLSRTFTTPTNNKIWTWSAWVKRGILSSSTQRIVSASTNGDEAIRFDTDRLRYYFNSAASGDLQTTQLFRDPSAWYHIVIAVDTTQATASNRVKIYVNGAQVTSFATSSYPAQNYNTSINASGAVTLSASGAEAFDGYMAEVNFVDGQALTPSSFGAANSITGIWRPKAYTGTYGTNGFYLNFADNSALTTASNVGIGKDNSGNGNYLVTNNISITAGTTYDSMKDVPTLTSATVSNYCVLNPIDKNAAVTLSQGNLTSTSGTLNTGGRATMMLSTGKWYYEVNVVSNTANQSMLGFAVQSWALDYLGSNSLGFGWTADGSKYGETGTVVSGSLPTYTTGDTVALAVDMDAKQLTAYKNGTAVYVWNFTGTDWFPAYSHQPTTTFAFNFGQRPFAYTPPTGFKALNTFNLPDSTIVKGNKYMDATLFTGTNAANNVVSNSASFKPDFVWIKSRSAAYSNSLWDSVRGVTNRLISDTTGAEVVVSGLTSFNSNGFTVGADATSNSPSASMVGWQWQAGQGSTSSNTSGSITSTVSVNATAGFSVVTYTGTGANATVGHGLGVAPKMIICKNRSNAQSWNVYHESVGNTRVLFLNSTDAQSATSAIYWNNTSPTSAVFSLGTNNNGNGSGNSHVAYCWAEIAGFSKFGSYTGNGSTDGTFIYTGFRPKYFLIKRSDTGGNNWVMMDSIRDTYNQVNKNLTANTSGAEDSIYAYEDFLSNGIKLKTTDAAWNASGGTYIYMAFAENPFKYALAR